GPREWSCKRPWPRLSRRPPRPTTAKRRSKPGSPSRQSAPSYPSPGVSSVNLVGDRAAATRTRFADHGHAPKLAAFRSVHAPADDAAAFFYLPLNGSGHQLVAERARGLPLKYQVADKSAVRQ